MDLQENLIREVGELRSDLKDLKRCQLQYFSISIAATGAILGVLGSATIAENLKNQSFLVPLTVILPCWLIFFDKATTITRIVGYQRILERQITGEVFNFIGWENALSQFRDNEAQAWEKVMEKMSESKCKLPRRYIRNLNPFKTRHRFWVLNWLTFFTLSLICCLGAFILAGKAEPFTIPFWGKWELSFNPQYLSLTALLLIILIAGYTAYLLDLLMNGSLSYKGCTLIWQEILKPGENKNAPASS